MLRIACPGSPKSTPGAGGTLAGLKHAASLGINAMEIEWVQSVPKNAEHVAAVGKAAKDVDMALTVHAPYFVNLNSAEKEKIVASEKRILDSLSMAQVCGALSVCVHAAFNGKDAPETVTDNIRRSTERIMKKKASLFPDVNLAYETMGRPSQWGTLDEVLEISKEFGIYPCVDVAHMHARANGAVNSTKEFDELLDRYAKVLGKKSLKSMHIHYSGIAYGEKGEKNHLSFEESDLKWKDFLKVLKKRDVGGVLVCESPEMEDDTMLLQATYDKLR
jgi:deoxyribonuclease-4